MFRCQCYGGIFQPVVSVRGSLQRIVCDATLAFIKKCNVLSAIVEMADFRELSACIKFCFKLGKTAKECYEMLKTVFGEQAMSRFQTFQWFSLFKAGRTST